MSKEFQPIKRDEVFKAINDERDYQDVIWPDHVHSTIEYLAYIKHYVDKGISEVTVGKERDALDSLRKIGALAVAGMEQNGCAKRYML